MPKSDLFPTVQVQVTSFLFLLEVVRTDPLQSCDTSLRRDKWFPSQSNNDPSTKGLSRYKGTEGPCIHPDTLQWLPYTRLQGPLKKSGFLNSSSSRTLGGGKKEDDRRTPSRVSGPLTNNFQCHGVLFSSDLGAQWWTSARLPVNPSRQSLNFTHVSFEDNTNTVI